MEGPRQPSGARGWRRLLQRILHREGCRNGVWGIIGWWEIRRLLYNGIVGAVGLATGVILLMTALYAERTLGEPIGLPDPPLFAVVGAVLYGVLANVCYTGGWIVETMAVRMFRWDTAAWGPRIWVWGTTFSVVLTLMPALIVVPEVLVRVQKLPPR